MSRPTSETFFLPEEVERHTVTIPAALHNRCRAMLSRCHYEHIFVPIRSMQYLGVIDEEEIVFVDSQAYAVRGGEGGRVILLAWQFRPDLRSDNLSEPVPIDVVYYDRSAAEIQKRRVQQIPGYPRGALPRERLRGAGQAGFALPYYTLTGS